MHVPPRSLCFKSPPITLSTSFCQLRWETQAAALVEQHARVVDEFKVRASCCCVSMPCIGLVHGLAWVDQALQDSQTTYAALQLLVSPCLPQATHARELAAERARYGLLATDKDVAGREAAEVRRQMEEDVDREVEELKER